MKVMLEVLCLLLVATPAWAGMQDRAAVERDVRAGVEKDLKIPASDGRSLEGRSCVDGRTVASVEGAALIEFWASMECSWCGIREVLAAQREHPEWCVVVRHMPPSLQGEGMRKAIAYEGIRTFSSSAANIFWDTVVPRTSLPMPNPYERAMFRAISDAAISLDEFVRELEQGATRRVTEDYEAGQAIIRSTPTFIMEGIRFPSCDFTARELEKALDLARKARAGDSDARSSIIRIITRGRMGEALAMLAPAEASR